MSDLFEHSHMLTEISFKLNANSSMSIEIFSFQALSKNLAHYLLFCIQSAEVDTDLELYFRTIFGCHAGRTP